MSRRPEDDQPSRAGARPVPDACCQEEGFGRLLRGSAPEASISPATAGRDTSLPRAGIIDFAAFPGRADTRLAGLLLTIPDLVTLDLPALVNAARYPGTAAIPPASRILSLLALKLTATRRVSHVDDLLTDSASALFAGLSVVTFRALWV